MTEKRKVGRPPKVEGEVLSKTLGFRIRHRLYAALKSSAEAEGRSISEEVEFRLTKSFDAPVLTEKRVREIIAEVQA